MDVLDDSLLFCGHYARSIKNMRPRIRQPIFAPAKRMIDGHAEHDRERNCDKQEDTRSET